MTETKTLLQSRTVWGALLAILASIAGLGGYAIAPSDQAAALDLIGSLIEVWDRLVVIAGAGLAIWGRVRATKSIG